MNSYWRDKTVVITGGSAGLGLQLAKTWGRAGAHVIIVGRNRDRLESVDEQLRSAGIQSRNYAADVTNVEEVQLLVEWIKNTDVSQNGGVNVVVNAAGRSSRGRAADTSLEEFESLWRLNFLGTVICAQAFLPMLRQSKGHLVNIGSIASKTAGPYLGGYPASKFAVAAFSQQLRLEMTDPAAHVLLVCPGPIARDDQGQRYESQSDDLPDRAKQPGGGASVTPIDPEFLADSILRACVARQPELIIPRKARLLFAIQSLSARWGDWIVNRHTS